MRACVYVCVPVHMSVCVCVCVCGWVFWVCMCLYVHVCACVTVSMCTFASVCMWVCIYMHVCMWKTLSEKVPLVEFMYLVYLHACQVSCQRQLRSCCCAWTTACKHQLTPLCVESFRERPKNPTTTQNTSQATPPPILPQQYMPPCSLGACDVAVCVLGAGTLQALGMLVRLLHCRSWPHLMLNDASQEQPTVQTQPGANCWPKEVLVQLSDFFSTTDSCRWGHSENIQLCKQTGLCHSKKKNTYKKNTPQPPPLPQKGKKTKLEKDTERGTDSFLTFNQVGSITLKHSKNQK